MDLRFSNLSGSMHCYKAINFSNGVTNLDPVPSRSARLSDSQVSMRTQFGRLRLGNRPSTGLSSIATAIPSRTEYMPTENLLLCPIATYVCNIALCPRPGSTGPPRIVSYGGMRDATSLGGAMQVVPRQNIWRNSRRRLAECGPRLRVDVRRRACGAASADVRWSVA
jgi:hypothetical protein